MYLPFRCGVPVAGCVLSASSQPIISPCCQIRYHSDRWPGVIDLKLYELRVVGSKGTYGLGYRDARVVNVLVGGSADAVSDTQGEGLCLNLTCVAVSADLMSVLFCRRSTYASA